MPQMAPISWLILFTVFSVSFIIFNVMNYFCVISPSPSSTLEKTISQKSFNWKW